MNLLLEEQQQTFRHLETSANVNTPLGKIASKGSKRNKCNNSKR
jgi:hypothetical protein